jgi:hypothetical protein
MGSKPEVIDYVGFSGCRAEAPTCDSSTGSVEK